MADIGGKKYRLQVFTLAELITVIAIALLIAGVVIGRTGKIPSFLSFENAVGRIRTIFSEASRISSAQGKDVRILFDAETRTFQLENIKTESKIFRYFQGL